LAELPRNAVFAEIPLRGRDVPRRLARNVEFQPIAKSEAFGHRRDAVDAEATCRLVEEDVARALDRTAQAERAVAALLPAMPNRIAEREMARAADLRLGGDDAGLERG